MSRANLLTVVVLVLALGGMFFWTLELHHRQSEMQGLRAFSSSGDSDPAMAGRLEDLEQEFDGLELLVRSQIADLGSLERKVESLEVTAGAQGAQIAALGGGEVAPSSVASTAGEPQLQAAIESVLEKREERDRQERTKRMAEGFSRFLLADVEPTDSQKSQFVKILTDHLTARDEVRRRYSGENADDQSRDAEIAQLEQDRNDQVLSIFGATSFQKIEERLNRSRRGMDGRSGSRGSRRGGSRR